MKRRFSFSISIILMLTLLATTVYALPTQNDIDDSVAICTAINLLQGEDEGVTPDYLETVPQRFQGAILLLRLLGIEDQALIYNFTENFDDYEDFLWMEGRNILGYLFENRGVGFEGYSDGTFRPFDEMTAKQYYKVMLVALGYVEYVDFEWDQSATLPGTLDLAQTVGLTRLQDDSDFRIYDLCVATVEALRANRKGSTMTLAEYLVSIGKIDSTVAQSLGLITIAPTPDPVVTPTATLKSIYPYEIGMATGYTSIQVDITDGTFKSSLGENNAETMAIVNNVSGSQNFATFINLSYTNLTRVSDTRLIIDFPKSSYNISADEEISVLLPETSFNENVEAIVNAGTITIEDSGAGYSTDPYAIIRPSDFEFIASHTRSHFKQYADLDFGNSYPYPIVDFEGVYDGNHFTISNFKLDATDDNGTGLFKNSTQSYIKNVNIENVTVNGNNQSHVAVLVGKSHDLVINNVSIKDSQVNDAKYCGFFVGSNTHNLTIEYAFATDIEVSSSVFGSRTGGLVGSSTPTQGSLNITNSQISGFTADTAGTVGGLVGRGFENVNIDGCNVFSLDISGRQYVGGVIGFMMMGDLATTATDITDCVTTGTISGFREVGGIVGGCHAAILTGNRSHISTFERQEGSASTFHRIVGSGFDVANLTLDNYGNTAATLYDVETASNVSNPFTDDAADLDGESVSAPGFYVMIIKPFAITPIVDPWLSKLNTTVEDLISPVYH